MGRAVTQIYLQAHFRKEVTSTVLWLLNFKVRVQCFRATPYAMGDELFLNVEQIIPTQDTEEYMIGMAEKAQDDIEDQVEQKHRHLVRREFWSKLIDAMNASSSSLYQNISPGVYSWIGPGSGVSGIGFNFVATRQYGRAELYIDRGDKAENEYVFNQLLSRRDEINEAFGDVLEWEPLEDRRACRIKAEQPGNVFDQDQWNAMITFMVDAMCRLEKAIKQPLREEWASARNGIVAERG